MAEQIVIKITGDGKQFIGTLDSIDKKVADSNKNLKALAATTALAFAAAGTAASAALKQFAEYEKALIGVGKTSDLSVKELRKFGQDMMRVSEETGFATIELLNLAQTAAQLGVKGSKNIEKFAVTMAKLATATDIVGSEGAAQVARILNVTGTAVEEVDNFGSVLVALGNNFAATEAEIASVATRVAQSTARFDISADSVAGIATALKALGVEAELGGSVIGRAFSEIDASIREGGESILTLSRLTGVAKEDLKEAFGNDAVGLFLKFVKGLDEVKNSGGDVSKIMGDLNLSGLGIMQVLPTLAKGHLELEEALNLANSEIKNAVALNKEFAAQQQGAGVELAKINAKITNTTSVIGERFVPALKLLNIGIGDLTRKTRVFFAVIDATRKLLIGGFKTSLIDLQILYNNMGIDVVDIAYNIQTAFHTMAASILTSFKDSLLGMSKFVERSVELAGYLPFAKGIPKAYQDNIQGFLGKIDEVADRSIEKAQESENKRVAITQIGFDRINELQDLKAEKEQETQQKITTILDEALVRNQEKEDEAAETKVEKETERQAEKVERELTWEEELAAAKAEQKAEEEEEKALLEEMAYVQRLFKKGKLDKDAADKYKKEMKKNEAFRAAVVKQNKEWDKELAASAEVAALSIFGSTSDAYKAIFLARKAAAIAGIIINTQESISVARATLPAGIAEPVMARYAIQGALETATVAGTMIQVAGAQEGGIVQGNLSGDRVPAMLEGGEIIVPKAVAPTFDDLYGEGFGNASNNQNVVVQIEMDSDASQVITAQQREDSILGVA